LTRLLGEAQESFFMAMNAVAAHKLRSALTLLGVMVGVFSIIAVMTTMRVMQAKVEEQISQLGTQTFMINKWPMIFFSRPKGMEKIWRRKTITLQQGMQFQEMATLPRSVSLQARFWAGEIQTRHAQTTPDVPMMGETPGSLATRNWNVGDGRFLIDSDVAGARDVCVLGYSLATNLFPSVSPVGEKLKIDGFNYTVVGVLESRGTSLGGDQDNFVVIPVTTGLDRYGGTSWRSLQILVQARDQQSFAACMEEAQGILRALRKVPPGEENDFEISSNDSAIAQFQAFTLAVRMGVALISSIALLAAGVGIMNIMLVSVTERTREIGVRRAIGAKKRNIMTQFILEAIMLCELGGLIGVALGILGGNLVAWYLKFPVAIPFDWVCLGLFICSLVGIIFGTYPAYKAANLDPIESLRYE
jgi:putative ABC transport system permease protein